jgi:hypothetical protein
MPRSSDDSRDTYADFEIEIGNGRVRVLNSPAGQSSDSFTSPFQLPEQQKLRDWLEAATLNARDLRTPAPSSPPQIDDPQRVGEALFGAVFKDRIYQLYLQSRTIVRERGLAGLRVKLRLAEDVEILPWELLRNPQEDYLLLTRKLTLVRYMEAPVEQQALQVDGPLRLLVIAGAPDGLDLATEINSIRDAIAGLVAQNRLEIDVLEDASLDGIYDKLYELQRLRKPLHIVHYLGHSAAPGKGLPARLLLKDEAGRSTLVPIDQFWRNLNGNEALRLIWLNSCSGAEGTEGTLYGPLASAAARFIASGIPAVLANQIRISDRAAQKFARAFYVNLADGLPIDVALAEARRKVSATNITTLEWATPILYMRSPDGVLFTTAESTSTAAPAANTPTSTSHQATSSPSPNNEDQQFISEQIKTLRRRLQQRQLQAAKYGIGVDPAISIEIEDLQKEIAQLESKLTRR